MLTRCFTHREYTDAKDKILSVIAVVLLFMVIYSGWQKRQ